MSKGLSEAGPHMNWTKDNKVYERYLRWKSRAEDIFSSILSKESEAEKCAYLHIWMGDDGYPFLKKWKTTGKLKFNHKEEVRDCQGRVTNPISSGYLLDTYWEPLEKELRPKSNNVLLIMELWTDCKQGNMPLSEWITKVYNLVELCEYEEEFKDRVIRDVLIIGCNSTPACDKIVRKGSKITLDQVIDLLQFEDHFSETVQAYNSHSTGSKDLHYLKYDTKKKAKSKPPKHTEGNPQPKSTPANSGRTCYRCKAPYTRGHEKICKALKAKCGYCQEIGHYEKCCRKAGNFPKKQVHIASAVPTPTLTPAPPALSAPAQVPWEYWDEDGKLYREVHMLSAPSKKDLLIQFDIGKEINSANSKVILKIDTGADVNALNRSTFKSLFPQVQLQPSNVILKNFDATSERPLGQFKCFLHWKGKYYCITMEVMDSDETPNILCREQTFFMNILKPCFTVQKDNSAVNMTTPVADAIPPEAHEMQSESNTSSQQIIPVGEPNPAMTRTEEISSSHSGITDLAPNTALSATVLSVHSKPTETTLMKESVLKNYSDIFQGLGKFPGEPSKLRPKPDSTPAKHRPRKVPLHLQDAFHEEVKRLVEIDVLEPVNEPTEWVNSFVVVEKQVNINTSNAHSPGHSIKKKKQICIDPIDNDDQQVVLHSASRKQNVPHTASIKYTSLFLEIGRFQWKQLPMETAVAVEIFQH